MGGGPHRGALVWVSSRRLPVRYGAWTTSRDGPGLAGTTTSPSDRRPRLPHRTAPGPKSARTGLTLYQILDALQYILKC
jgi:hypothetical protein